MNITETKQGSCHCKAVTYTAKVDLTQPVIECNCSYCEAKGYLLAFIPEESFSLDSGKEKLIEYRFNTKKIQHFSCEVCGVAPFAFGEAEGGQKTIALNVRTLSDISLANLTRQAFDGKSL